jgi:uncharacterized protein (DUF1330 family)
MPAYLVACVRWHNAEAADSYGKLAVESLRPFGGKYLVRGAPVTVLEGSSAPERLAIIEFPTTDAVRQWHASKEYAAARHIRHASAATHWIMIMEGVPKQP